MNRELRTQNRENVRSGELWTLAIVLVPIAGLIALFAYGAIGQRVVARRIDQTLSQFVEAGLPTNNHEMTVWYEDHTSEARSAHWRNVTRAAEGLNMRFIDRDNASTKEMERVPAPGSDWDVAPIMEKFVSEARPILDAMSGLLEDEEAVWDPVILVGTRSNLYTADRRTSTSSLIADEFRVSVHAGDQDRALDALRLMNRLARSVDAKSGPGWDHLMFKIQNQRCELIRQTLNYDFWRPEDLSILDQMLHRPDDLDTRYRRSQEIVRAMTVESIESENLVFYRQFDFHEVSPSEKLAVLRQTPKSTIPPSAGVARLIRDLDKRSKEVDGGRLDPPSPLSAITGLPTTSMQDYLRVYNSGLSYFDNDMFRRWTRTAVAIKRYLAIEGSFPENLSDLGSLGLSRSELLADGASLFGYEQNDERAILWTRATTNGATAVRKVGPEPPSQSGHHTGELVNVEVVIR